MNYNEASFLFRLIWKVAQFMSIFLILIFVLIFYDYFSPIHYNKSAQIKDKVIHSGKGHRHYIVLQGDNLYKEPVSKKFYSAANIGDYIEISIGKFTKKWKSVKNVTSKNKTMISGGISLNESTLLALFLPLTLFSFKSLEFYRKYYFLLWFILFYEFGAVAFFFI